MEMELAQGSIQPLYRHSNGVCYRGADLHGAGAIWIRGGEINGNMSNLAFAAIVAREQEQVIKCPSEGCAWWNAEADGCGIVRNLAPVQEYEGEDEAEEPGEPFRVL